jgi:putative transposase
MPVKARLSWVNEDEPLAIALQCDLLDVPRSSWYYKPVGRKSSDAELMKRLDRLYTDFPFYGVPRMVEELRGEGMRIGPKRVRRLLRQMGLMAVYPKPRLSLPGETQRRFPYLLRGVTIERPDHVWSTDITYIPMAKGHLYLVRPEKCPFVPEGYQGAWVIH